VKEKKSAKIGVLRILRKNQSMEGEVIYQTDSPQDALKTEANWPEDHYVASDVKNELYNEWNVEERLKDFEGVEVPDIPDVKSEYDKIYDQYFRVTADHMPPDPVVEAQRAEEAEVKKEIEEAEKARVKEEQKDAPPEYLRKEENPIPRELRSYKCRICDKVMKTKYEFYVHVNKHEAKCVNCNVVYKSWKKLEAHEPYCTRRFGRTILQNPREERAKTPKLNFKCSLCKRRYAKYSHLYEHQVKRCKKRYVRDQWVVKIWRVSPAKTRRKENYKNPAIYTHISRSKKHSTWDFISVITPEQGKIRWEQPVKS